MAIITHFNVFIQPVKGEEILIGVTDTPVLKVVDGFLIFEHRHSRHKMGINAAHVAIWRLEPEYSDATKNT